jgi:hypothetical protein
MASYVLVYKGGGVPDTDEARQASLDAWGKWYEALGPAVVDGGNPFAHSVGLAADGSVSQGAPSGLTGYTILSADTLDQASDLAKGCPILADGGSVEVYETFQVM